MNDEINAALDRYAAWREHRDDALSYEAQHGRFPDGDLFASDDEGCALADEMARLLCDLIGRNRIYSIHEENP